VRNFLTCWKPVSFSRRTLLRGVSKQVSNYALSHAWSPWRLTWTFVRISVLDFFDFYLIWRQYSYDLVVRCDVTFFLLYKEYQWNASYCACYNQQMAHITNKIHSYVFQVLSLAIFRACRYWKTHIVSLYLYIEFLHGVNLEWQCRIYHSGWVYCTIPVFLIFPTLAARCLSRPQPAVVP
jgi:hypothetical protein